MRRRCLLLALTLAMIATGYVLGVVSERKLVWNADRALRKSLGIRPESLPEVPVEESSESVANGLAFEQRPESGVTFSYDNGPDGQFHLAETVGGGVGTIDIDADQRPDLVFVDGGNPTTWPSNKQPRIELMRQTDRGRFSSVITLSGLTFKGFGHGCAIADFNNDGFDDVLVTGYQHSVLYVNLGDGSFRESDALSMITDDRWCTTACWYDLDADGDLDLYIACYADTPRTLPTPVCESGGKRIHCNPHSYGAVSDLILENTGDGRFQDRSDESSVAAYNEYGMGVMAADFDRDGVTEIFVANDGARNLLFRKVSNWQYEEVGLISGVAFNGRGETMGAMGVACGDFDANGRLDILTTNFSNESNTLYHQVDNLSFVEDAQRTVFGQSSRAMVGWSAITIDANCDTFPDLFVANGHVTQMPSESWAQRSSLFMGAEDGFYESRSAGEWFSKSWHARGACRVDLNQDALDDLVVSLIDSSAALLVNTSRTPGNRIQLQLIGVWGSRSAEGAIVELKTATRTTIHLVTRNAGYLSSNSATVTLGLGAALATESLLVHWPGGGTQEIRSTSAGERIVVIEGRQAGLRLPPEELPLE